MIKIDLERPESFVYMKCIFVLFIISLIISCNRKPERLPITETNRNDSLYVIDLDSTEKLNEISISSFFSKVELIILETTDESIIGEVSDFQVFDDYFYILDCRHERQLKVFDREGKYIRSIGNLGRGPGEYSSLSSFTIDAENKEILLLCDGGKTINKYDMNGIPVSKILINKMTFLYTDFIRVLDDKIFANTFYRVKDTAGEDYLLQMIDSSTGEQEACFLKTIQNNKGWNERYFMKPGLFSTNFGGIPKFIPLLSDTIFSIDKNGITPFLTIKSKHLLTQNDVKQAKRKDLKFDEQIDVIRKTGKIQSIHNYLEFNGLIYFQYWHEQPYRFLFNPSTDYIEITNFIRNDLLHKNGKMSVNLNFADQNNVYECIEANSYLMRLLKEASQQGELTTGNRQLAELSDEANPVIIRYSN